jgi:nitrate/nitrite transporter NarK
MPCVPGKLFSVRFPRFRQQFTNRPSEIFPVRLRTPAHGIAAATGEIGGFFGVFLFPYLMHWHGLPAAESPAALASAAGLVLTWLTLPEPNGRV